MSASCIQVFFFIVSHYITDLNIIKKTSQTYVQHFVKNILMEAICIFVLHVFADNQLEV
jgi:hypothetical protein